MECDDGSTCNVKKEIFCNPANEKVFSLSSLVSDLSTSLTQQTFQQPGSSSLHEADNGHIDKPTLIDISNIKKEKEFDDYDGIGLGNNNTVHRSDCTMNQETFIVSELSDIIKKEHQDRLESASQYENNHSTITPQTFSSNKDKEQDPTVFEMTETTETESHNSVESALMDFDDDMGDSQCVLCIKCNQWFDHQRDLDLHDDEIHLNNDRRSYKCQDCGKLFVYKNSLTRHQRTAVCRKQRDKINGVQKISTYKCKVCSKSFENEDDFIHHKTMHSKTTGPFKCHICNEGFSNNTHLSNHYREHMCSPKTFECSHCCSVFGKERALQMHLQESHRSDNNEEQQQPIQGKTRYENNDQPKRKTQQVQKQQPQQPQKQLQKLQQQQQPQHKQQQQPQQQPQQLQQPQKQLQQHLQQQQPQNKQQQQSQQQKAQQQQQPQKQQGPKQKQQPQQARQNNVVVCAKNQAPIIARVELAFCSMCNQFFGSLGDVIAHLQTRHQQRGQRARQQPGQSQPQQNEQIQQKQHQQQGPQLQQARQQHGQPQQQQHERAQQERHQQQGPQLQQPGQPQQHELQLQQQPPQQHLQPLQHHDRTQEKQQQQQENSKTNSIASQQPTSTDIRSSIPFCYICCLRFDSQKDLHHHVIEKHRGANSFDVPCQVQFENPTEKQQTLSRHEDSRIAFCFICCLWFRSWEDLNQHVIDEHKTVKSANKLTDSNNIEANQRPYEGTVKSFTTRNGIDSRTAFCYICCSWFGSWRDLDLHVLEKHQTATSINKPAELNKVKQRLENPTLLSSSLPSATSNAPKPQSLFKCTLCGKSYEKATICCKPHKCTRCKSEFGSESDLKLHHEQNHKLFVRCKICEKLNADNVRIFTSMAELNKHVQEHIQLEKTMKPKEPVRCSVCDKQFMHQRALIYILSRTLKRNCTVRSVINHF